MLPGGEGTRGGRASNQGLNAMDRVEFKGFPMGVEGCVKKFPGRSAHRLSFNSFNLFIHFYWNSQEQNKIKLFILTQKK